MEEAGIHVIIPDESGIELVNNVIYQELCMGIISPHSKEKLLHATRAAMLAIEP